MTAGAVGVGTADQHRVFLQQIHQRREGEELALFLIGLQAAVQLQNGFQRADGENVPALGHVGLHARKDPQAVGQLQYILPPAAHRGEVAVELIKVQRVEMLRQAQGIQPGPAGLAEEPVGVDSGKGKLFGQLPVGVKIKAQGKTFFQSRVEHSAARAIHKADSARNSRSL